MGDSSHARQSSVDRSADRAGITNWIVKNPVPAFAVGTLTGLLLAAVLWWLSLIWPFGVAGIGKSDLWSNASTLVQAILGTALVGASAFVAIMIATSATRTAEASMQIADSALVESRTSNKLASPQYQMAFDAYVNYLHLEALVQSFDAAQARADDETVLSLLKLIKELLTGPALVVLVARCEGVFKARDALKINDEVAKLLALDVAGAHGPGGAIEECGIVLEDIRSIVAGVMAKVRNTEPLPAGATGDRMVVYLREMLLGAPIPPERRASAEADVTTIDGLRRGLSEMIREYLAAGNNVAGALILRGSCTFSEAEIRTIILDAAKQATLELSESDDLLAFQKPGSRLALLLKSEHRADSKVQLAEITRIMRSRSAARGIVIVTHESGCAGDGWLPARNGGLQGWLDEMLEPRDDVERSLHAAVRYNVLSGFPTNDAPSDETDQGDPVLAMRLRFVREHPPQASAEFSDGKFDMAAYAEEWSKWVEDAKNRAPKLLWISVVREADLREQAANKAAGGPVFATSLAFKAVESTQRRGEHPESSGYRGTALSVDIPELHNSQFDLWTIIPEHASEDQ